MLIYIYLRHQSMEELIRQAFLHIDVIGEHVAEGRYDLVGPDGDIILPQVWETVVEPDWTITMHMWPIPEKPKDPEPAAEEEAPPPPPPPPPPPEAPPAEEAPGGDAAGKTTHTPSQNPMPNYVLIILAEAAQPAPKKKPAPPGAFAMWMAGKPPRALKAEKKPEAIQQQEECCVM